MWTYYITTIIHFFCCEIYELNNKKFISSRVKLIIKLGDELDNLYCNYNVLKYFLIN